MPIFCALIYTLSSRQVTLCGPLFVHYTEGAAPDQTIFSPAERIVGNARQQGILRYLASQNVASYKILRKKKPA